MTSGDPTNPPTTKPKRRRKTNRRRNDRWDRIAKIAGAAAAVLGVASPIIDLPGKVENAFGRNDSKKAKLELAQKRAEVAAAAPRIDVSYVMLDDSLVGEAESLQRYGPRPKAKEAITLLSFPAIENEIVHGEYMDTAPCRVGDIPDLVTAYLVVENRGRRDASGVTLRANRLRLRKPIRINENGVHGDDYVAKLHAAARAVSEVTVTVPRTLGPGDGVRIPLWGLTTPRRRSTPWCVISKTFLEPLTVRFEDPVLGAAATVKVRRLASPEVYATGVVGRG